MFTKATAVTLLSVLGLASAVPTPVELAPRCGTTIYPSSIQRLSQSNPAQVFGSSNDFAVNQGVTSGQINDHNAQILTFNNIPAGSSACQLNLKFPSPYNINTYNNPTLDITTIYKDSPATPSNTWSWNTIFSPTSKALGQGQFGSVGSYLLAPGQSSGINTESCPVGGGSVSFLFGIASWVSTSSSAEFTQSNPTAGFYLTYNC